MARARTLVDADVHAVVPSTQSLFPYLSAHWRDHVTNTLMKGVVETAYPRFAPTTSRKGLDAPNGPPAGSSLEALQRDVLDCDDVDFGNLESGQTVKAAIVRRVGTHVPLARIDTDSGGLLPRALGGGDFKLQINVNGFITVAQA